MSGCGQDLRFWEQEQPGKYMFKRFSTEAHKHGVTCVRSLQGSISSEGDTNHSIDFATAGRNGKIRLWDIGRNKCALEF